MVVTIFRSRLNPEHTPAYYQMAARMRALAENMPASVKTTKEDVSPQEMQKRVQAMFSDKK